MKLYKKKKIGILTWHHYSNVGSNLQAIAMQNIFTTTLTETEFINYRPNYSESWYRNLIRFICSSIADSYPYLLPEMFRFRAYSFQKHYMKQSKLIKKSNELANEVLRYDAVICGSDQIWAPNVFKKEYLLSFVPDVIKKYSYAASIGLNVIPVNLIDNYVTYLKRFLLIGVREAQGAKLITELIPECAGRIVDVLDPTFLVPVSYWDDISILPKNRENYLFCYFLGNNVWQREYASKWAKDHGLKIIIYSSYHTDDQFADSHIYYMGPREFIGYIRNASHVMTDSFHGTTFSIIYKKQFNIFYRFEESDSLCQNSRINNLIDKFDIGNTVVSKNIKNDSNDSNIDYTIANKKIEHEILRSKKFANKILRQIGGYDA